jgi:hypothetical protein
MGRFRVSEILNQAQNDVTFVVTLSGVKSLLERISNILGLNFVLEKEEGQWRGIIS